VIALLSWTHYIVLMSLDDNTEIDYYIHKCITNNLSVRRLRELIKSDEYHRLPDETINKILNKEELTILDEVKNPII